MSPSRESIVAAPKVLLHDHLDGGVRPATVAELAAESGYDGLPTHDVDELAAYRDRAPGMPYAHPTVEHYTPLFITLGAASDPETPGDQVVDGYWMGLSKRSLQVA